MPATQLTQHSLVRPPLVVLPVETRDAHLFFMRPLRKGLRSSVVGDVDVCTFVIVLLCQCRPTDITRSVVATSIRVAINTIASARMISQSCIKFFKRLKFAADAACSVERIVLGARILAALFNLQIRFIDFASGFPISSLAMRGNAGLPILTFPTSATLQHFQMGSQNNFYCPTFTDRNPFPPVRRELKGVQYTQFFGLVGSVIKKDRHGASPHDALVVCAATQRGTECSRGLL